MGTSKPKVRARGKKKKPTARKKPQDPVAMLKSFWPDAYPVRYHGSGMEPTIIEGDTMWVTDADRNIQQGQLIFGQYKPLMGGPATDMVGRMISLSDEDAYIVRGVEDGEDNPGVAQCVGASQIVDIFTPMGQATNHAVKAELRMRFDAARAVVTHLKNCFPPASPARLKAARLVAAILGRKWARERRVGRFERWLKEFRAIADAPNFELE